MGHAAVSRVPDEDMGGSGVNYRVSVLCLRLKDTSNDPLSTSSPPHAFKCIYFTLSTPIFSPVVYILSRSLDAPSFLFSLP